MKSIKGGKHPVKVNEVDEMLKQIAEMFKDTVGKPNPNTTGVSYSGLLLQLIKPYQQTNDRIPIDEMEYLLDMGIAAWNLAVYKKKNDFLYQSYLHALKHEAAMDKSGEQLLKKLVADKEKLFGHYNDMLLEDFEITEGPNGQSIVNVVSKPLDAFLQESFAEALTGGPLFEPANERDEGISDDDEGEMPPYVLPVINRNAVIIKPKTPFFEWLRKIYFPEEPPRLQGIGNIYMLPEYETEKEVENYVKKNFDRIFCSELWGWNTDEKNWPLNRTYKMFTAWFEIIVQPLVYDVANYPLEKD